jgi:hypothetical protein
MLLQHPILLRLLVATAAITPTLAYAIDRHEIQVYEEDVNDPGHFGLELHTNYAHGGRKTPDYAGELAPAGVTRFTLEPAYGLSENAELGAYLQMALGPDGQAHWAGAKLRVKLRAPQKLWNLKVFMGLNIELGAVPKTVEEAGWANEFRPFIGWRNRWILVDFNPIFGYALSGKDAFKPDFEPAGKVSVDTQHGVAVGAEYYAGIGPLGTTLLPLSQQEHLLFGVLDLAAAKGTPLGEWEVNLAVGKALTHAAGTDWVAKTIVGRSF